MFPLALIPTVLTLLSPFFGAADNGSTDLNSFQSTRIVPEFEYYSRSNGIDLPLTKTSFRPPSNGTIIVYIHGLTFDILEPGSFAREIKSRILNTRKEIGAVILVDWTLFSDARDYALIVESYSSQLAQSVSEEIQRILEQFEMSPSNFGIVAHCVGAHVAGQVGRILKADGKELKFIIGLDPLNANPLNPDFLLRPDDAQTVVSIHTDDVYGINTDIGTPEQNIYVKSGQAIYACRNEIHFWSDHACKHMAAREVFILSLDKPDSLLNPEIYLENSNLPIEPSALNILLLDVSPGMQGYSRIQNMLQISRSVIKSTPLNAFVGMILFGEYTETRQPPLQIQNETSREMILANLPTLSTQIRGVKSIGTALQAALRMSEPFLKTGSCPQILLLTDGEKIQPSSIEKIRPNLTSTCIKVHSVSLAAAKSMNFVLGNLSSITNGQMAEFSDAEGMDALMQSFDESSLLQMNPSLRHIELLRNKVNLEGLESSKFIMDSGIGRNTKVIILSRFYDQIQAQITDPHGNLLSSIKPNVDKDLKAVQFQIPDAAPGEWTVNLRSNLSVEQNSILNEATILITSMATGDEQSVVRLEAKLSNNILNYTSRKPVSIQALLGKGNRERIVGASLITYIQLSDGDLVTMKLHDNGAGADNTKDDGIYSAYITGNFTQGISYSVFVEATNNGDSARMRRIGDKDPYMYLAVDKSSLLHVYGFQRRFTAGSFQVIGEYRRLLPSRVRDLKVRRVTEQEFKATSPIWCELTWTAAVAEEADNGTVTSFVIEGRSNPSSSLNTGISFSFNASHVKVGSLDPLLAGEIQTVTLEIPTRWLDQIRGIQLKLNVPFQLYFSVQSFNSELEVSGVSNIAVLNIREPVGVSSFVGIRIFLSLLFLVSCGLLFNFARRFRQQFVYTPVNKFKS